MINKLNYLIVLLLVSAHSYSQKDSLIGFWEIEKVAVGSKNMTPVAKWTKINSDGTFQSGNGWLQNAKGKWNYNASDKTYSATDPLDVYDEYGGFSVLFAQKKMYWERIEDGMKIKVTLRPIEELPAAPADYLEGIWDLVEITENDKSVLSTFDPQNNHKLFIRWDRIYINFSSNSSKSTGYWHIHGHKSEITFLPHQQGKKSESWKIDINEKELIMNGISENNRTIQRKYVRKNTF